MPNLTPLRLLVLLASTATLPCAAQMLPATPPTVPAPTPAPAPAVPQTPAQQPAHRARVELTAGLLTVAADNSSLNQILREIGRLTGMKITGGVTEERVFGNYGPADTSSVLSALLGGTGSNMLLIEDNRQAPQELVLTPRQGGPTPPNPNATRDADDDRNADLPPQLGRRISRPGGFTAPPRPPADDANPTPVAAPAPPPAPVAPAADTTTQESPNGVKTPQQIYDQLMKMQQQQPRPPGGRLTPP